VDYWDKTCSNLFALHGTAKPRDDLIFSHKPYLFSVKCCIVPTNEGGSEVVQIVLIQRCTMRVINKGQTHGSDDGVAGRQLGFLRC
jgi:hypothetical protein